MNRPGSRRRLLLSATLAALTLATGRAWSAADPATMIEGVTEPRVAITTLLRPRLVSAPVAAGKGARQPSGDAAVVAAAPGPDALFDALSGDHVRVAEHGPKRLAARTIIVCQREGDPWRDRLVAYLEEMFGSQSPLRVIDASTVGTYPADATVVAFSDTGRGDIPCIERDARFDAFVDETPRPRRLYGRPVLCPSSVDVSGDRVRWYFADMNFSGPACEAARFGELLGLPRWARDPARNHGDISAIRAYLWAVYGGPDQERPRATGRISFPLGVD